MTGVVSDCTLDSRVAGRQWIVNACTLTVASLLTTGGTHHASRITGKHHASHDAYHATYSATLTN